jgi:drug/metabolite transporter (DMT)-like permease
VTNKNGASLMTGVSPVRQALLWAGVFGVLWAILELGLVSSLHRPINTLEIVWWRYGAHLGVVALLWGLRSPGQIWRTSRPVSHILRSLMMLVMPGAFALAVARGVSANFVWSVFWLSPALIIGFDWLFLKERPPAAVVLLSVIGALAAAALFDDLHPPSLSGLVLALAVAMSFSAYVVATRSMRTESIETNLLYTALPIFLLLTPVMFRVWSWPDAHDAVILVVIGVVGFVALYALDRACHAAPAWAGADGYFIQTLLVTGVIALAHHDELRLHIIVGAAAMVVVLGGLWIFADRFAQPGGAAASRLPDHALND